MFFGRINLNDKSGHSGKTMSSGVRKRKRHKLCKRLFSFFQKFNTKIAVVYHPKKEMHHNIYLEKSVKVKNSVNFSFLRISAH